MAVFLLRSLLALAVVSRRPASAEPAKLGTALYNPLLDKSLALIA